MFLLLLLIPGRKLILNFLKSPPGFDNRSLPWYPQYQATDKQCTWGINIVAMAIVDITSVCIFKDITITNKCYLRTGLFSMQCRSAVFLGEYSIVPSFWAFQPLSSSRHTIPPADHLQPYNPSIRTMRAGKETNIVFHSPRLAVPIPANNF